MPRKEIQVPQAVPLLSLVLDELETVAKGSKHKQEAENKAASTFQRKRRQTASLGTRMWSLITASSTRVDSTPNTGLQFLRDLISESNSAQTTFPLSRRERDTEANRLSASSAS